MPGLTLRWKTRNVSWISITLRSNTTQGDRHGNWKSSSVLRSSLMIELPKGGYVPVLRPVLPTVETGTPSPEPSAKPRLRRVWLVAAIASLAAGVAAAGWWRFHQNEPIPIAVLPLRNLSPDPANDYFADGLTGEIIRNLSIIEGLAVRSQTSSFAFKGKQQNVREAGGWVTAICPPRRFGSRLFPGGLLDAGGLR